MNTAKKMELDGKVVWVAEIDGDFATKLDDTILTFPSEDRAQAYIRRRTRTVDEVGVPY